MPVYKDKQRGTWYVSYTFKELPSGLTRHKTKRGFKNPKDAKKWERENYAPTETRTNKTFEELAIEWEVNNQASEESKRHYSEHVRFRLNESFKKNITDISRVDLIEWRNWLISTDYSTKTKNNTITFVRSVISFGAMMYGYSNEAVVLKRVKATTEEIMHEMNIWTPEEFDIFIKHVSDRTMKTFFSFLFWTGCRRGEAIALQRKDISGNKVLIRYSQRTKEIGLKPTKTRQIRWITLDSQLTTDISELMSLEPYSSYVFCNPDGSSISATKVDICFKKGIKESGVKKIRIHDLRHSHATWLINNGVNIVAVSKRLGHATIDQTLKTYTHLIKQSEDELVAFIDISKKCPTNVPRKLKKPSVMGYSDD